MSYVCEKYIYSITNIVNGKKYIGQTDNYLARWKQHLLDLKARKHCNSALQKDFNRFGKDAFVFNILEARKNRMCLEEDRERYWMVFYRTYTEENGYNYNDIKAKAYVNKIYKEDHSWGRKVPIEISKENCQAALKEIVSFQSKYKPVLNRQLFHSLEIAEICIEKMINGDFLNN